MMIQDANGDEEFKNLIDYRAKVVSEKSIIQDAAVMDNLD